jgi:hypothetical protein
MAMEYANKLKNETIRTRDLGMQINNHLNWKKTYRTNSFNSEFVPHIVGCTGSVATIKLPEF